MEQREKQRKFLEQLLDGSKVEDYKVPVTVFAELRRYQQVSFSYVISVNCYELLQELQDVIAFLKGFGNYLFTDLKIIVHVKFFSKVKYKEM